MIRIAVFRATFQGSRGRCPACGATMDSSGCRVIGTAICAPTDGPAPALGPELDELRALLAAHPLVMDVECYGIACWCQRIAASA